MCEGEFFEVSGWRGDSGKAEMFLADCFWYLWWAIFWTAEASGQERSNPGRGVFLAEFMPQGRCFWRARRGFPGRDEGLPGPKVFLGGAWLNILSERLLGGFSGCAM